MKIFYKSKDEIGKLHRANIAGAKVLDAIEGACKPGASTWDLNEIAIHRLKEFGAKSAFLGYANPPYPAVLCTSINEVIVHGIPRKDEILKDGDIIGIDFGLFLEGYCADSARTICVGDVAAPARKLVEETKRALDLAIEACVVGKRLYDIGWAVQSHIEPLGYSVVRSFVGHGIGRAMHEDPPVPNYGSPDTGPRIKAGLVVAIEPMINVGRPDVEILEDGWTAVTRDRTLSAHFEHSVAVTDEGTIVLSRL